MNSRLISHPVNWLVVWSMMLIGFYLGHLVLHAINGSHPGTAPATSSEGIGGPGTADPADVI